VFFSDAHYDRLTFPDNSFCYYQTVKFHETCTTHSNPNQILKAESTGKSNVDASILVYEGNRIYDSNSTKSKLTILLQSTENTSL